MCVLLAIILIMVSVIYCDCLLFRLSQITPDDVAQLEYSRQVYENQLRELEWRLEQESKVMH